MKFKIGDLGKYNNHVYYIFKIDSDGYWLNYYDTFIEVMEDSDLLHDQLYTDIFRLTAEELDAI